MTTNDDPRGSNRKALKRPLLLATVLALGLPLGAPGSLASTGPAPPDAVAAVADPDGTILITWTPSRSDGVTEYRVYRVGFEDGLAGSTPETSFVDQLTIPPVPVTIVEYRVVAVADDTEGPASQAAYVVLLDPLTVASCVHIIFPEFPFVSVDPECIPP